MHPIARPGEQGRGGANQPDRESEPAECGADPGASVRRGHRLCVHRRLSRGRNQPSHDVARSNRPAPARARVLRLRVRWSQAREYKTLRH